MSAGQDFETRSGDAAAEEVVAPLPRITLQAFCETPAVAATMQAAIADRRMDKAHAQANRGTYLQKRRKRVGCIQQSQQHTHTQEEQGRARTRHISALCGL